MSSNAEQDEDDFGDFEEAQQIEEEQETVENASIEDSHAVKNEDFEVGPHLFAEYQIYV
jgi:hypothetical protein